MSKINTKIKKKKKLNTAENLEKEISQSFRCTSNRINSVPLLYRLVYSSKFSFITVFILLLSFVFQGASLTYADEVSEPNPLIEESVVEANEIDEVIPAQEMQDSINDIEPISLSSEEVDKPITVPPLEEVVTSNDLLIEDNTLTVEDSTTSDTSPPLDDPPINEDTPTENTSVESLPNNEVLAVIDNDLVSSTTSTSTLGLPDTAIDGAEPGIADEPPSEVGSVDEGLLNEIASTTESVTSISTSTNATSTTEQLEEAVTVTNSDTEFTFNRSECTTLASGSFYCLKADTEILEDALFAAPDIDGDLEIYLVRAGIQSQVTSNQVDDAAPYFDQNSDTIVWHRLIEDRYQIISYDISTGEETQLTTGTTNSMEPTRQGKYTVWQNWSNNNWNIVLFDGNEQRTITESTSHDIAPYIHGSLVVWNRYSNGQDKTIEMYDMISETYVTVDDPEGLSVTNPRMVFVYDSLHPNGDVVTKGYDMISRKFIQLDTLPRQLPDQIPESESTGETRALIQSKPTVKSDESIQNNNATSSGPTPPTPPIEPLATTSDLLTLDLTIATSSAPEMPVIQDLPTMTEYELIIPPLQSGTETVQE